MANDQQYAGFPNKNSGVSPRVLQKNKKGNDKTRSRRVEENRMMVVASEKHIFQ